MDSAGKRAFFLKGGEWRFPSSGRGWEVVGGSVFLTQQSGSLTVPLDLPLPLVFTPSRFLSCSLSLRAPAYLLTCDIQNVGSLNVQSNPGSGLTVERCTRVGRSNTGVNFFCKVCDRFLCIRAAKRRLVKG